MAEKEGDAMAKRQTRKAGSPGPSTGATLIRELGVTGLGRFGGWIVEEFLTELRGIQGRRVFREMAANDATVGAMLFAVNQLVRQVDWGVEPATGTSVDTVQAAAAQEYVKGALFEDMSHTWQDALTEILSELVYGWAYLELVYKYRRGPGEDPTQRSRFLDGGFGWRKWAIRAQETLYQWELDSSGGIQGMTQQPPPGQGPVDAQGAGAAATFTGGGLITIPIDKALLFRTRSDRNNPEGVSMLRTAYRAWYFKKRIEEVEGIGVERDLAGLPVLIPPPKINPWDTSDPEMIAVKAAAERLIRNIRRDQQEGVFIPNGWELQLLTTGGRRQFDTTAIIERYDTRIAMSLLADFILLGHQAVGSWALSSDKTQLFAVAVGGILDSIAQVVNRHAIPRLMALNGWPAILSPRLTHGDLETPDLDALGNFVQRLAQVGAITLDPKLQSYLREAAGLPLTTIQDPTVGKKLRKGVKLSKREKALVDAVTGTRQVLGELRAAIAKGLTGKAA